MAKDINSVVIEGRAGRDSETRFTSNGKAVTSFSVATGGKYTDKKTGQQKGSDTEWHNIVHWGELTIRKGDRVHCEGQIARRKYTDKNGVEKSVFEIKCWDAPYVMEDDRQAQPRQAAAMPQRPIDQGITDDDVPF